MQDCPAALFIRRCVQLSSSVLSRRVDSIVDYWKVSAPVSAMSAVFKRRGRCFLTYRFLCWRSDRNSKRQCSLRASIEYLRCIFCMSARFPKLRLCSRIQMSNHLTRPPISDNPFRFNRVAARYVIRQIQLYERSNSSTHFGFSRAIVSFV